MTFLKPALQDKMQYYSKLCLRPHAIFNLSRIEPALQVHMLNQAGPQTVWHVSNHFRYIRPYSQHASRSVR